MLAGQVGDHVLHHHHRRVHQHADGDGQTAQGHQVGGQAELTHQDKGGQGRQRQHQGHGEGGPQIAKKQHQQHQHQHDRLAQGFGDRALPLFPPAGRGRRRP